ncbi:DNA polymerase delta subunit 2 [Anaeramoeba flamelloides]|uniref:DNA polymerase delta subunit 2 n=1 Tax=Anaeramoeba flamelloides TaxID=1746091 RepID=A0ABQ8X3D9_9EUKA|nr:DNA polymerase delta subunit 2 [Anaeramoeba flamelloides]
MNRLNCKYTPLYERFKLPKTTQELKQFNSIYVHRIKSLRPILEKNIAAKWINDQDYPPKILKRVIDVSEQEEEVKTKENLISKEYVLIGTVYKDTSKKPNILDEYSQGYQNVMDQSYSDFKVDSYFSKEDQIVLEDENGRIYLIGDSYLLNSLVTGIVVAVKGIIDGDKFEVNEICYPGLPKQSSLNNLLLTNEKEIKKEKEEKEEKKIKKYVALISGLEIGNPKSDPQKLELLLEYLTGFLEESNENGIQTQIVRAIVCGNSLFRPKPKVNQKSTTFENRKKDGNLVCSDSKSLDQFISRLSSSMPVDLMPGESDPSNLFLPQQPFHPVLFPFSRKIKTFNRVTNPYECKIDNTIFVGNSGEAINDIAKYYKNGDLNEVKFQVFQNSLNWCHLSPTCPDTLPCHPFENSDPFIIKNTPHVYFAGNQDQFSSEIIHKKSYTTGNKTISCIFVPKFYQTSEIVLVDIETLESSTVSFNF